mgnify:CR=1 FL=1
MGGEFSLTKGNKRIEVFRCVKMAIAKMKDNPSFLAKVEKQVME